MKVGKGHVEWQFGPGENGWMALTRAEAEALLVALRQALKYPPHFTEFHLPLPVEEPAPDAPAADPDGSAPGRERP